MKEFIAFNNSDGSCAIMIPATDQLTIEQIAQKDVPPGALYRIMTFDKLPKDSYFFSAWTINFDTNVIDVDMIKARAIHLANIKNARQQAFLKMGFPSQLDPDLERAIIPLDTRNKLNILRDIPQNLKLEDARTPEELKIMWPQEIIESAPS